MGGQAEAIGTHRAVEPPVACAVSGQETEIPRTPGYSGGFVIKSY